MISYSQKIQIYQMIYSGVIKFTFDHSKVTLKHVEIAK